MVVSGGNIGGNFKLDPTSGVLSASSLDRETIPKYVLTVSARDKGRPSLEARCNITVIVLDVNDNPPSFAIGEYGSSRRHSAGSSAQEYESSFGQYGSPMYQPNHLPGKYLATVSEDVPADSSIITVRATDPDQGANGKITYSVAEETSWLFRVDNLTGVVTTAG